MKRLIYVNEYADHKPSSGHKRTCVIMLNLELLLTARNTVNCTNCIYVQQRTLKRFDLPIRTVEIGINYVTLETFFGSVI